MFPVEIRLPDENDFAESVAKIWKWADLQQLAPLTFRYTFGSSGVVFQADFGSAATAAAFAAEFGGRVLTTNR